MSVSRRKHTNALVEREAVPNDLFWNGRFLLEGHLVVSKSPRNFVNGGGDDFRNPEFRAHPAEVTPK